MRAKQRSGESLGRAQVGRRRPSRRSYPMGASRRPSQSFWPGLLITKPCPVSEEEVVVACPAALEPGEGRWPRIKATGGFLQRDAEFMA